jgi:tripartite-type tricarboxylate transporter receptor subunit TctC
MQRTLRIATAALVMSVCLAQPLFAAQADPARDYPSRPVRFIVPFVPGAGTDITTRIIAKKLAETWGQQVVADNRSGAAGAIGADIKSEIAKWRKLVNDAGLQLH